MDAIDSAQKMRMDFQQVIDRLKVALGVESNRSVADHLGLSSSNLGERKNRGALPHPLIEALCQERGINYSWVISGVGPMRDQSAGSSPGRRSSVSVNEIHRASERRPSYGREIERMFDPSAVGAATAGAEWERNLLLAALEAVEMELDRRELHLPAERRMRLVWALFQMSLPAGRVPDQAVGPLVELVLDC